MPGNADTRFLAAEGKRTRGETRYIETNGRSLPQKNERRINNGLVKKRLQFATLAVIRDIAARGGDEQGEKG